MSETAFLGAVFALVEFLAKTTITTSSKKLIIAYLNDAPGTKPAEKARSAIRRYIQEEVPSLEKIREKSKTEDLSELDHLVLKMEYEATRLPS